MEWIDAYLSMPKEGEYVLIFCDGFIGISRYFEGEWDVGDGRKRPMFNKNEKIMSKLEALYWMPLPQSPKTYMEWINCSDRLPGEIDNILFIPKSYLCIGKVISGFFGSFEF